MRILGIVALCVTLGGCAASRQEVAARLGQEYIGKNVDVLVVQWGPPASTFKMNSGETSYVWQLGNQTNINTYRALERPAPCTARSMSLHRQPGL
jgi:hypothetical protein